MSIMLLIKFNVTYMYGIRFNILVNMHRISILIFDISSELIFFNLTGVSTKNQKTFFYKNNYIYSFKTYSLCIWNKQMIILFSW